MNELIQIKKPKTRTTQVPNWWFRYLDGMELRVVGAILSYADNNGDNAYPSNKLIAFMRKAYQEKNETIMEMYNEFVIANESK